MTIDTDRYIINANKPYKYSLNIDGEINDTKQLIDNYAKDFNACFIYKGNTLTCVDKSTAKEIIYEMFEILGITSVTQAQTVLKFQHDSKTFGFYMYKCGIIEDDINDLIKNNKEKNKTTKSKIAIYIKTLKPMILTRLCLANLYDEQKYLNELTYTNKHIEYVMKPKIENKISKSGIKRHHTKHEHFDDFSEPFSILLCDEIAHNNIHKYYGKSAESEKLLNDILPIFNETNYEIKRKLMIEFIEKRCGKNWLTELKQRLDNFNYENIY